VAHVLAAHTGVLAGHGNVKEIDVSAAGAWGDQVYASYYQLSHAQLQMTITTSIPM